ncbi:MAG: polysaccharide biosynthesis protein [Clostridiales bacterium]|jgi:stage V sporulation protein B|nr:polysaccharide biosynthesis protein [Clostridiales bacterium]
MSALILTLSSLITKILGFFYRIYISNKIGAECLGLYQLILPIYTLVWSISCAGFTTAISKLIAQEDAKKNKNNINLIIKQSLIITSIISFLLSIFIYFQAKNIANLILKDDRLFFSLKILSISFIFMSLGSCIRGYFFGLRNALIPAISQVIEQIAHILTIFFLINKFKSIKDCCAVAVFGIMLGEIASTIYVYICFKSKKYYKKNKLEKKQNDFSFLESIKKIFLISLPLGANKIITSLLSTFENILIPQRLILNNNFNLNSALILYGKLTGMAMPLIQFPSIFLLSLSVSLVPDVSHSRAIKNQKRIDNTISKTLLYTSLVSMFSACFFITFSHEIGIFIYHQNISNMLKNLGILCPLLYLNIVLSGILNGFGRQFFIFKINLISSFINLLTIYFLIPKFGINAFFLGLFLNLIITTSLYLKLIKKNIKIKLKINNLLIKPLIASFITFFLIKPIAHGVIFPSYNNLISLIINALIMLLLYFILILYFGCISLREIKDIIDSFFKTTEKNERT